MRRLLHHNKHAMLMMLMLTALLGGVVPALFTVVAQLIFPTATHGTLIVKDGKTIGSALIGQEFTSPKYFWGRLSATTPPYNAAASAASNFSMANSTLLEQANGRMAQLPKVTLKVPVSLLTASASGLDPHISPLAADFQAARVAKERNLPLDTVNALIAEHTEPPYFGIIGTARVNVLALNMALDKLSGTAQ